MSILESPTGLLRSRPEQKPPTRLVLSVRAGVLLLPVVLLLLATLWVTYQGYEGRPRLLLWLGTAFQILLSSLIYRTRQRRRQPLGMPALILNLIALAWLWLGLGLADLGGWYLHLCQGILLVVSMTIFAMQVVADSGAREAHHAYLLAQRLADRKDWPADLESCQRLPEVKALREALRIDAAPAFDLLRHARPQVRIAALAALEFRRAWQPGQAELVLEVAQRSPEPAVRTAAISALANVDDRSLVEKLAEFLGDPVPEVRRAATEALLWNTEQRWLWIRSAVRRTLSNLDHQDDGPLVQHGPLLATEAVSDLNAWVTEKGALALRSALTLSVHYGRALNENPDPTLIRTLGNQVLDSHAPVILRIEVAHLLHDRRLLEREALEKLLDPLNPAPLRLLAAESLLTKGAHAGAVTALRDVARMPNREIALATADVVQRRMGIDMGLALGQPLPPLNSRQAAEVTRRVMKWAFQHEADDNEVDSEPLAH